MKALEKAAEERDRAPAEPSAAGRELTLEALEAKSGTGYAPSAARPAASADAIRSTAQINAATVLNARQPRSTSAVAWMNTHPLYVFGGLAACFLLAYAAYVYIQVAHPAWLTRTPPAAPAVATPNTAPRGAVDSTPSPLAQADMPVVPAPSVFDGAGGLPRAAAPANAASDRKADANNAPPPAPRAIIAPQSTTATTGATATTATAAAPPPAPAAPQNRISVSRGDNLVPRVNPAVSEAYAALQAGQFDAAQRLYSQALKSEPANVDALLGLAAIAQKDNRLEDAQRYFMTILQADPRHALAQSGLIALMGRADPQAAESRLKQLLAREPSPPLYFNLGNLYADQGLWPQAQQAYFQAHSLEPANPDYAYNLAVGLEHLGQQKLALGFYRKALALAPGGAAHFDTARIQDRIKQLSARFE